MHIFQVCRIDLRFYIANKLPGSIDLLAHGPILGQQRTKRSPSEKKAMNLAFLSLT